MPGRLSAGLLVWRPTAAAAAGPADGAAPDDTPGPALEVLLVHPGGPFWAKKDDGAWSIPKGEVEEGEEPLAAAEREFHEELGRPAPPGSRADLGEVVQRAGKHVRAWAVHGDLDAAAIESGTFSMEWPPRSGRQQSFPEVDRAGWFGPDQARRKLLVAQLPLLDRLFELVSDRQGAGPPPTLPD